MYLFKLVRRRKERYLIGLEQVSQLKEKEKRGETAITTRTVKKEMS